MSNERERRVQEGASEADVARAQKEALLQAQAALGLPGPDGQPVEIAPMDKRNLMLAGTLPVIQGLFLKISELLGSLSMSEEEWEATMGQLRQHVARAVTDLASVEDGDKDEAIRLTDELIPVEGPEPILPRKAPRKKSVKKPARRKSARKTKLAKTGDAPPVSSDAPSAEPPEAAGPTLTGDLEPVG